jgi:four helix bundle protein
MRRASVSIGANIAQGACRSGNVDFAASSRLLWVSASELEYHWLRARDLEWLRAADYQPLPQKAVEVKECSPG